MSDGSQGAPVPVASAPSEAIESQAPINNDSELEALEQELDGKEESSSEPSSKGEPKEESKSSEKAPIQAKADKAAKSEGAKKIDNDTYKIKVDGEDVELSREEMVKFAQMGKAGQKRMAEAAQIKQEALQLVEMLQKDPKRVLADPALLGSDEAVIEFAKKILADRFEEESKDPAILRAEKAEKELEDMRAKQKEESERKQKDDYQRLVQQEEAQLEEQITEALGQSGLPKSPFVLKRLADVMISAAEREHMITPKQALNIVKREMQKDLKEYFDLTPEDALEELLSADKVKNLRKRQLAKLKASVVEAAPSLNNIKEAAKDVSPKEEVNKKISMKDWLRR